MKVTGFSFIRNAIRNDYPIVEAISSILPICDEFVIAHGNSEDDTLGLLKSIGSPKLRVIQTEWDESLREGGRVFAAETNKAFAAITADTDWAFYIQGDECVHEKYLNTIRREMEENLDDSRVEGLLFRYKHFYGSYDYYAHSRRWYRREIRVLRYLPGVHSYRDAQGFRIHERKLRVKQIDAAIYHYGWVKPPEGLTGKVRNFNTFYHDDTWIDQTFPESRAFDYGNADRLVHFTGTHPRVMEPRVKKTNWKFSFDPTRLRKKTSFRRKLLQAVENLTGYRPFEYRNYRLIRNKIF